LKNAIEREVNRNAPEFSPSRIDELITKVDALALEIAEMTAILRDIKESFEKDISNPRIIIVEEMDKKTAKQKVLDFMRSHKTSDIAELHENIKCDIAMLIEIIDELCEEENIAEWD
jgi:hypothetical protein